MTDYSAPQEAPRDMLTIQEAARRLSVGRSTVYSLLESGNLESVCIGRLRRIPVDYLDAFVRSRPLAPPVGGE